MASSFGGTVKLTGESEYRKALRDITTNLREVSSELKLTNTQFSAGDKTVRETKNSYTNINTTIQEQKGRIAELKTLISQMTQEYNEHQNKLAKVEEQYGKNSKEALEYKAKLGNTENQLKTFKTQLNNAETQLVEMKNATDKNNKELKEMENGFNDAGQGAIKFGDLLKANVLGDFITSGLRSVAGAVKQVGSTLLSIGKDALDSYADYEQFVGGIDTLFKDSSEFVQRRAANAYQTAGLSANEYMETVTSFSASLIQSLGGDTKKAAEYADRAIVDMSDNANKMGTDMTSIQYAYNGFAKQNYTMLDNLKLGYGGTQAEMQRLIKDASKMTDIQKELGVTVDGSSMSFGNIVNAISVMQKSLDIAGTTAKEASTTISGSVNSMKSAWSNLLVGIADDNADFDELVSNLIDSLTTVMSNIMPRVEIILKGCVQLISEVANTIIPEIAPAVSDILQSLITTIVTSLPTILDAGMQIAQSLLDGITNNLFNSENGRGIISMATEIIETLVDGIVSMLPGILDAGIQIIFGLISGLSESLPELIPTIIDAIVLMAETLIDNIDLIIDAGIELILGLADGLIEALPDLIDKIPEIIEKLVDAIVNNLPKIIEAGIELTIKLAEGLVRAIPRLTSKIPQIITSLVRGFINYYSNLAEVGKNLVSGIWEGIKNAKDWLLGKVKEWCGNIINGIKGFFGIHSPSKVFKDEIGKNLALGVGEGFLDTMKAVSNDMQSAIPTEFDINSTVNKVDASNQLTLEGITKSFVTAVKNLNAQIIIDKDVAGKFVITSVNSKLGEVM